VDEHHTETTEQETLATALGQAACGIVHDFANLLQTIVLRAEIVGSQPGLPPAAVDKLARVVHDGSSGAALIRSLLEYARGEVDHREAADLRPVLDARVRAWRDLLESPEGLQTKLAEGPMLARFDPRQMEVLLDLLLLTLYRGAEKPIHLQFSAHVLTEGELDGTTAPWVAEAGWIALHLRRSSPGPAPQRLMSSELAGSGAEFSLSDPEVMEMWRIRGIARQHRGQVEVSASDGAVALSVFLPSGTQHI
jgi:hypothetical protein